MKPTTLLFLLALAPAVAGAAQPFSAERSWQIQRIGSPEVSPDGRHIVAPVARASMDEDKLLTDLWLWSADGRVQRALTGDPAAESSPRFSPDGQTLAFIAQRDDDKAPQLYLLPLAGGEARRLTTLATGVSSPRWFADGRRLLFASRVWADLPMDQQEKRLKERTDSKMKAQVWDGGPVTVWDNFVDDRQGHVFSVDVATGAVAPLSLGRGLELPRFSQTFDGAFDISPDGRELAITADSNPAINVTNVDVFTLALAGGTPRNLSAGNAGSDGNPLYSPDGKHLAFLQQRVPGFYDAKARLMLHARGGATRELHADWDRSASGLVWSRDSRTLYGAIDDAGTVRAYELPLSGQPRAITGAGSFNALQAGPEGLVGLRQTFIEPPTLVAIDLLSGKARKLSTLNDALLADTDFGTYESVTYKGANGADIQMWVNYPPGFDKSKRYPLFMLIHGGPHNGVTDGMSFRWNAQVFGSWGYVTAWPNFHGSSGFGEAFSDSINPEWAEKPYQDVIKAAEWFADQRWIDPERMVAGGASYGGYLTSVILGREHPFKALVAHAKVYNLYTQYAADFAATVPRFGGFWEEGNREVLERNSPQLLAGNFKTPTLVIHGQRDLRVPVNHGLELYHTLLVRSVPTRFVYFPDENHWVLKPQNSLFWYAQVQRWFQEHGSADKP